MKNGASRSRNHVCQSASSSQTQKEAELLGWFWKLTLIRRYKLRHKSFCSNGIHASQARGASQCHRGLSVLQGCGCTKWLYWLSRGRLVSRESSVIFFFFSPFLYYSNRCRPWRFYTAIFRIHKCVILGCVYPSQSPFVPGSCGHIEWQLREMCLSR